MVFSGVVNFKLTCTHSLSAKTALVFVKLLSVPVKLLDELVSDRFSKFLFFSYFCPGLLYPYPKFRRGVCCIKQKGIL